MYTNPSAGMIGCPLLFDNRIGRTYRTGSCGMCVCISVDDRNSGVFSLIGSPKICGEIRLCNCELDGVSAGPIMMDNLFGSPKECSVFQLDDVMLSSLKGAPGRVKTIEINPFAEDDLYRLCDIDADIDAATIIIRGSSILQNKTPVSRNNIVTVSSFLYIGRKLRKNIFNRFRNDIMVSRDNTDKKKLESILGPKVLLDGEAKLYIDNHGGDPAYK